MLPLHTKMWINITDIVFSKKEKKSIYKILLTVGFHLYEVQKQNKLMVKNVE